MTKEATQKTKQGKYLATVARPTATINQATEPELYNAWLNVLKKHDGSPAKAVKAAIQFYNIVDK